MKRDLVDRIVEAVLYEGYLLYPYRPSSAKNRQRFTFGRVYPRAYSDAQRGREPCVMQTQGLVEAPSATAGLSVRVRFLHPMAREVGRLPAPSPSDGRGAAFEVVPSLQVGDDLYQTWQEAVEQEVATGWLPLHRLAAAPRSFPFRFEAVHTLEPLRDPAGREGGRLRRRQHALAGTVEVAAAPVDGQVFRVTVRIRNETPVPAEGLGVQDEVLMRTFASTHTLLDVQEGAFVSLLDPPAPYAATAAACRNEHTWPVLVGDPAQAPCTTLLSSPVILYDYPQIAPESPGDLFDGLEIDEILTLRILTMTDAEKAEMRGVDARARQILERTEAMPEDALRRMHGTLRDLRPLAAEPAAEDFFGSERTRRHGVTLGGVRYAPGGRVRIRPKKRTDVWDLALDGMTAVIEAVEQDFEDRIHLALVLEDDPGRDLGLMRQPGHRFFYSPDDVEPLGEDEA